MDYTEKKLRRVNSYSGIIVDVEVDQIELYNGNKTMREVVQHPGGVCILPLFDDGTVLCVRQFRYPFGEHLLELPAGKLEKGESPVYCAVRELSEETGLTAGEMIPMGKMYPSPGYCHEILHLFLARDLTEGKAHLDTNEFLDVVRIPLEDLVGMAMSGEISDAKTALLVLKAKTLLEGEL
jgi:ADP-ribose pyrophosphatase